MFYRLFCAFIGASVITITMFLGMSEIVELFEQRDPARYFQIVDFIPSSGARRRPDLVLPESQPSRPRVDQEPGGRAVIEAEPSFSTNGVGSPRLRTPRLETPAVPAPDQE
jgi:hypothetical protein